MWNTIACKHCFLLSSCLIISILSVISNPTIADSSFLTTEAIVSECKNTLYQEVCETSLTSFAKTSSVRYTPIFDVAVQFAASKIQSIRTIAFNLSQSLHRKGSNKPSAMDDCIELLDDSLWYLNEALDRSKKPTHEDLMTWLSASLTSQTTCLESLQSSDFVAEKDILEAKIQTLSQYVSNSLAICASKKRATTGVGNLNGRKLLTHGFPTWVSAGDRKLLETPVEELKPSAIVAKDGSGTHRTISEAIAATSLAGSPGGRTVIYLKAGTYNENIRVLTKQKNVMLVGDGKGSTVVVAARSAREGWTTFQSPTVAASGDGFIARDLTIINNAGPDKHQAVALRVGGDRSVIYRVQIVGYQDTLYTHKNRQFYRDCDVTGTVDFIFGNAAAILQNCNIQPRKPLGGQKNSITAQGRSDPNQNTGIVIDQSKITASSDLSAVKGSYQTFLGRPWRQYSRTVIKNSYLDDSIDPAGWEAWSGSFALSTLYYAESMNTGPGSSTSGRVRWPGVRTSLSAAEVSKFSVSNFIGGDSWIPSSGAPFN